MTVKSQSRNCRNCDLNWAVCQTWFFAWRGPGPWTRGFVPLAVWPIRREEGGRKRPRPLSIVPPTPAAHGHHRETPANCYFEPLRELPARRRTRCCFTAAFYSLTKVRETAKAGRKAGRKARAWRGGEGIRSGSPVSSGRAD